jgi:hypothetical protein
MIHLPPFRSKYHQHSVLKNPQFMFLSQSERPSFEPIQHNWQNYSIVYFNLDYLDLRWEDKRFWTEK